LARLQALATAEAGIEYAMAHRNACRTGCGGQVADQGSFFAQVARADQATNVNWLLDVSLLDSLLILRLLGLQDQEWIALSQGTVGDTHRIIAVRFTSGQEILAWEEVAPE